MKNQSLLPKEKDRIAWYNTNDNEAGYNVFALNEHERKEFGKNAFRITSFKYTDNNPLQWTSIVKIEYINGVKKVRYINNILYTEGIIKYSRPYKIKKDRTLNWELLK